MATGRDARRIGDRAGEHLSMRRGRYGAWAYVVVGFILQVLMVTILAAGVIEEICKALGLKLPQDAVTLASLGVGSLIGIVTFRNRWRVVEAFSSRFCSGLVNFSMVYVPFIAWGYANWRAVLKLRGE
jgi:hypothetical protein